MGLSRDLAAKPAEDGLEAQCAGIAEKVVGTERGRTLGHDFAAFIRTYQAVRERELREVLQDIHDAYESDCECDHSDENCCAVVMEACAKCQAARALASHWPAQKDRK